MRTDHFLQSLFFIVFLLAAITMNAQVKSSMKLTNQQQSIVAISALTAKGDLESLKTELTKGLEAGLTINEIKELLVQLYAYCGFPRSLNGINTFMQVLEERKTKGIQDPIGKPIYSENKVSDKYEQGRKVLETLTKTAQKKSAPGFGEFAPRIDVFLKEHLFADVFASDVLSYEQRELITISALATLSGVEPQLQSHVNMGKNTGITETELLDVASLIEKHVNRTQANILRKLLSVPLSPIADPDLMVRISEIEIHPEHLEAYKAILKEESAASVIKETGVIAIFPMYQKENPTQVRIVEIYANKEAYESHLHTPHFQLYKTSTMKMVKSLKLLDMDSMDQESMLKIFRKLN